MPRLHTRELGAGPARCRRCQAVAIITVRESRYVRSAVDLLDRRFDPSTSRTAHCGSCNVTYPIRSTDESPAPAAARRDDTDVPRSRDWRYPDGEHRAARDHGHIPA